MKRLIRMLALTYFFSYLCQQKAFSLGLLLRLGLPNSDLNVDRDRQQSTVSDVALNDNNDIRLSAFTLNRMGKF